MRRGGPHRPGVRASGSPPSLAPVACAPTSGSRASTAPVAGHDLAGRSSRSVHRPERTTRTASVSWVPVVPVDLVTRPYAGPVAMTDHSRTLERSGRHAIVAPGLAMVVLA